MRACISAVSEKVDICTEKHIETTNRFMDSIIGNSMNIVGCGEYPEDSNKCKAMIIPNKRKHQRRTKSLVMAFLYLIESFPEANDKQKF